MSFLIRGLSSSLVKMPALNNLSLTYDCFWMNIWQQQMQQEQYNKKNQTHTQSDVEKSLSLAVSWNSSSSVSSLVNSFVWTGAAEGFESFTASNSCHSIDFLARGFCCSETCSRCSASGLRRRCTSSCPFSCITKACRGLGSLLVSSCWISSHTKCSCHPSADDVSCLDSNSLLRPIEGHRMCTCSLLEMSSEDSQTLL